MAKAKAVAVVEEPVAVVEEPNVPATNQWGNYQGPTGTENFGAEDVNIPRLKLLQDLSPEVKDGLGKPGDLFHTVLKTVILEQGSRLRFIPIAGDKQFILWRDRNDGGGIMARANRAVMPNGQVRYMWDKPNTTFEHKITQAKIGVKWSTKEFIDEDGLDQFGTSMPGNTDSGPAATLHYNYVVMLPDFDNQMVAISMSKTGAKKARDLIALLKMGRAPQWARVMELATVLEKKDQNSWFNWAFAPHSVMSPDDQLVQELSALSQELTKRGINVDFTDEEKAGGADDAGVEDGKATKRF